MTAARLTKSYITFVLSHPRLVLGVLFLLWLPCAIAGIGLRVNNTITTWFLETDPGLQSYYAYQKVFGNDEVVIVALHDPEGVFNPRVLEHVRSLSSKIQSQRYVQRVISVATATAIEAAPEGLSVRPMLPETGPINAAAASDARRMATEDPLWQGNIISDDLRTTLLIVQMKAVQDIDAARTEALARMREQLESELGPAKIPFATGGIGVIYDALNILTVQEGAILIGLSYLIIIASMLLILRRGKYALLGLGVVYVTVALTMGLYGLTGRNLNMVTVILPSLLLVIVIADFVHVITHFHHAGPVPVDREERRRAVVERVGEVAVPCFYASITTATGFLALATSPISLVRDLGLFGGLGAGIEWLVTMTLCALALDWMEPVESASQERAEDRTGRFLAAITAFVLGHRRAVAVLVTALTAFFVTGLTRLHVDTYTVGYFRDDHQVRRDHEFISRNFGYYLPIELTVKAAEGQTLTDPEILARMERSEEALSAKPQIRRVFSLTQFVKRIRQVLHGGAAAEYRLPETKAEAAQGLLLYQMDRDQALDQYLTKDQAFGRLSGRMEMMSVRPGVELMNELSGRLQGIFGAAGRIEFAGYLPLYVKIIDYLVQSQVQSFALACVLVFGPMFVMFRSLRLTLVSAVPNILPVVIVLGAMGWLGIPLDVATVTIAAIVLGIAVDDTIHFLHGFRERLAAGHSPDAAIEGVIRTAGRAVVTTTLMLFFGFAVMGVSSVKPIAYFGVLSGASLLAGLVCEFLVTPLLLSWLYRKVN